MNVHDDLDFVPRVVIASLCAKYRTLNIEEKKQFLLILARDLHVDTAVVRICISMCLVPSTSRTVTCTSTCHVSYIPAPAKPRVLHRQRGPRATEGQ